MLGVIKPSHTMKDIQRIIDSCEIIVFESGTYKITNTLHIPSDRIIHLGDAILRRYCSAPVFMTHATKSTTRYNGAHDIKIFGGTIEGMNSLGLDPTNMVLLFHANNVSFLNTTFLDTVGSHAIDIGGCKDVYIVGCKFLGYKSYGRDFREAIQIDFAYHGGIPYFDKNSACFDYTHCNNINIIGCRFDKSTRNPQYVAIGTHSQTITGHYHDNINILNNVAVGNGCSNYMGFFVRLANMCNVNIRNNIVSKYGRFVLIDSTINAYDSAGNKCGTSNDHGCKHIDITDNVVQDSDGTFVASTVFMNGTSNNPIYNVLVEDNIMDKEKSITANKYSSGIVIRDNKVMREV